MKRLSSVIYLAMVALSLWGNEITKTIQFSDLKIQQGKFEQVIELTETKNLGVLGSPILPYRATSFVLPENHKLKSVNVEYLGEPILYKNVELEPVQGVKPISSKEPFVFQKNQKIYHQNTFYPQRNVGNFRTDYLRGIPVGMFTFTPTQYNPVTKEVRFFQHCKIILHTELNTSFEIRKGWIQEKDIQILTEMVENPDALTQYSVRSRSAQNMLILTNELPDESALVNELFLFYKQKGYETEILDLETIQSNFTGLDFAEKMRNAIIDRYENSNLRHVLLAGDADVLPFRGMKGVVESSSLHVDENIPSDLYFSALDGSWDDNGNGIWGEENEDDLLPDVSVARLPFSNESDANNMIHKILSYQKNPVENELTNPLLIGEHLYDDPLTWGADYLDLLVGNCDDNGYETTGIPTSDNITTMHDRDQGTWNPQDLFSLLNNGGSFIHHAGHSNWNYTMRLSNPDITNENFYNIDGETHNYQFLYTHGCICGAFDANDCIAEEMLKIDNFLHTFVGNSRYGWFNEGQTEGPSAHLHREFVNALYTLEEDEVGEAHRFSKVATAPWVTAPGQHEPGALRWCFYECNVLGDPTLRLRTAEPAHFTVEMSNIISPDQESFIFTMTSSTGNYENIQAVLYADNIIESATFDTNEGYFALGNVPTEPTIGALAITGENIIPVVYPIYFIHENQSEISIIEHSFSAETIDFSMTPTVSLTLKNLSINASDQIQITAFCENEFIDVSENVVNLESLDALEEITVNNAFSIAIDPNIPDQTSTELSIQISSSSNVWNTLIPFTVNAPEFIFSSFSYNDSDDSFYAFSPNETGEFSFEIQNTGHATASDLEIAFNSDFATISHIETINQLNSLDISSCLFDISISENAMIGNDIDLDGSISYNGANYDFSFSLPIGLEQEDFSSEDFTKYPWKTINSGWNVTGNEQNYYAKTMFTELFQTSSLYLTVNALTANQLRFDYEMNAEGQDKLLFLVDNEPVFIEQGQSEWQTEELSLEAGQHLLEWRFKRDAGSVHVQSAIKLDNIMMSGIFPLENSITCNQSELNFEYSSDLTEITQDIELTNNSDEEITVSLNKIPVNRSLTYFSTVEDVFIPNETNNFHLQLFHQTHPISRLTLSFPEGTSVIQANNFAENTTTYLTAEQTGNSVEWTGSLPASTMGVAFLSLDIADIPVNDTAFKINYEYLVNGEIISGAVRYEHNSNWLTFSDSEITIAPNSSEVVSLTATWNDLTLSQDYRTLLHVYPSNGNSIFIPIALNNVVDNDIQEVVTSYELLSYPNPFSMNSNLRGLITLKYALPYDTNAQLEIYNLRGQKVKEFHNLKQTKGSHSVRWNMKNDSNESVASGLYFCALKIDGEPKKTTKIMILK